jgi:hypothetical protein
MEEECDGQLPFLDVMIDRRDNTLSFDVYRKPTSTKRYITSDSFHPQSHKNAAFHSMAHRMCNFRLSNEKYKQEKESIIDIGRLNGYKPEQTIKIIRKYEKIKERQDITTFSCPRPRHSKYFLVGLQLKTSWTTTVGL